MKITTTLLIIFLSINLVACGGGGSDSPDNTNNSNTGNSNTGNSNTGDSNSGDSNSGDSNSDDSNSDDSNSDDSNSGDSNSDDSNSDDSNSDDSNSGDSNSDDSNSDDSNAGDSNSGDSNSGDSNSGDSNSGDSNSDDSNSDDSNSGDSNSGDLDTENCLDTPTDTAEQPDYQRVYDNCIVWDENTGTGNVTIKYNSNTSESTGLGLRIHYNSASMTFVEASNVFSENLIITPETQNDNEDYDQNNNTDKFINAAWAAFTGYWAIANDQDLATLEFQKVEGGSTNYNLSYTASSITPGITFNP